jgi:hypothetical protein
MSILGWIGKEIGVCDQQLHQVKEAICKEVLFTWSQCGRVQEEIFASSFAAAAYLKSVNFPSNKKVAGLFSPWSKHLLKLQNSSAHFK